MAQSDRSKPDLVEREAALDALAAAFTAAASGAGCTVLVGGEAGIGKSTIVARFADRIARDARVLIGGCEALSSPRPLGPLYDVAGALPAMTRDLLGEPGQRAELFAAVLAMLDAGKPTVFVVEDAHWADAATLDLVKYLGRRIARLRALLVITYRDDELDGAHPLRLVLGDLPATAVVRVPLPPLSAEAVHALAQASGRPGERIYSITGGNPFFVTELLRADGVPESVAAAVRARATRQVAEVRALLELAAIVPARIERALVDRVLSPPAAVVDAALACGLLRSDGDGLAYRHELARLAVEQALSPLRARDLHAQVLQALDEGIVPGAPGTRFVHHASGAGASQAVLRHARRAADEAAAHASYREAAALLATALDHAQSLEPPERAKLYEGRAYRCYLTDQIEPAVAAREAALAIWRDVGDVLRQGDTLRWLSRLNWFLGRNALAERHADEAIALLEALSAGRELGWAYSNRAQLDMLAERTTSAVQWGERAVAIATQLDDAELLVHALNNIGTASFYANPVSGSALLERSLDLARRHRFDEHVSRAYANLTSNAVTYRHYGLAARYFDDAQSYFADRDLDAWANYTDAWRARQALETGHWEVADAIATRLSTRGASVIVRIPMLAALARLRSRRGDPGADALVREVVALADATGELQRIAPALATAAEHAWLHETPPPLDALASAYAMACERGNARCIGELGYWLWKFDAIDAIDPRAEAPYREQVAGAWKDAAQAWAQLGCPFERALALLEGDAPATHAGLAILDRLGATAAGAACREKLRRTGARGLPRGPRPSTAANPSGLTRREMQVLVLLAQGLQNGEIARRLVRSEKTVDHHVSAILAKLSARSRTEAAAIAHRLGVTTRD